MCWVEFTKLQELLSLVGFENTETLSLLFQKSLTPVPTSTNANPCHQKMAKAEVDERQE
jgi:hypothetical protein